MTHRLLWLAGSALTIALVACSQSQTSLPPAAHANGKTLHPLSLTQPTAVPSGSVTVGGTIYAVSSGKLSLSGTTSGGTNCGYEDVTYDSSAKWDPSPAPTPAIGQHVQLTGIGNAAGACGGTITSVAYISDASSTIGKVQLTGTVSDVLDAYAFTLVNGSTKNTIVRDAYYDSTAVPVVGDYASVTGYGIAGSGHFVHAISVTLSTPTPMPTASHIRTVDFEPSSIPASTYGSYVDWLQISHTTNSDLQNIHTAHVKVALYDEIQTLQVSPSTEEMVNFMKHEDDWSHSCSNPSARTTAAFSGETFDITNPQSADLQADYANAIESWEPNVNKSSSQNYDSVMEDDAGPLNALYGYPGIYTGLPCNWDGNNPQQWANYDIAMEEYLLNNASVPTIINGLDGSYNGGLSVDFDLFTSTNTAILGGRYDNCYTERLSLGPAAVPYASGWAHCENTELHMPSITTANATYPHPMFWALLGDEEASVEPQPGSWPYTPSPTASPNPVRYYGIASFLLSYDTQFNTSSMFVYLDYQNKNEVHVFPEEQLVVADPVVSGITDISQLESPNQGAYVREFYHCFLAGQYVGPCAAAVNPNPAGQASRTNPLAGRYGHTLVLRGGDIVEQGTASTNGQAPPSSLAPGTGVVMFQ